MCFRFDRVPGFIFRLLRKMGCFFGCFRIKDADRSQSHIISDSVASKGKGGSIASRNQLSSLLLSEEKEGFPCEDLENHNPGSPLPDVYGDGDVRELKDEAKFLKACGALLETPAEIRKASEKIKDAAIHNGDSEPSNFHSWLPGASIKKLQWDEHPNQISISPVKLCEELGKESDSQNHTSVSSMPKGQELVGRDYTRHHECSEVENPSTAITFPLHPSTNETSALVTPEIPAIASESKNKCVRFKCELDTENLPSNGKSLKSNSSGRHNESESSPYPTPLKLTDEMQTPGTIYPVNLDKYGNGNNARIRSQYVYPVLNPVENFSQWKALKEEDFSTHQEQLGHTGDSLEEIASAVPEYASVSYSNKLEMEQERENMAVKESKVDASLSHWLKPSSPPKDDADQNCGVFPGGRSYSSKTSDGDRPILGMVAAHWNDEEPSRISSKWWDGNGIPNSTNKYKEDQKVHWHATPFEERLEKALSEESLGYKRKLVNGRPINFEENEETDTAVSRLPSSLHPESVVSF
ncbi:PREDICTED: protein JASON-like isoform X3 [Nelumbo nucifera]|uniref:Protein JASON-like isoform X3 n=1 Tax=Nelumbo nucifera TaxID=4432 RepID=A0A1U8B8F6_NELNU|nr:PREDICTED: protein JASON-like isoform X3 [Nelumbo nucifera]